MNKVHRNSQFLGRLKTSCRRTLGIESLEERRVMTIELISSESDGTLGNGDSGNTAPAVSQDGRYVAFTSIATNLVAGDTNGKRDIFLKDTVTGVTKLISTATDGTLANSDCFEPAISADGRYIAFTSYADNLVTGDTNNQSDIFLKDTVSGKTTLISSASDGTQGNSISSTPTISADAHFVAFVSQANNLVTGDTNNQQDVFLKDTASGVTTRISTDSDGKQASSNSYSPSISADGKTVVFSSTAQNLVTGDTNNRQDVFVKDTVSGKTTLMSSAADGKQGNSDSYYPSISADGRHVTFVSRASNLAVGGRSGQYSVFIKYSVSGAITRVNSALDDYSADSQTISGDGRYVTFRNGSSIVINDIASGATKLLDISTLGGRSNGGSYTPVVSADGRYVVFSSSATNLVNGDTNNRQDVFRASNPFFSNNPSLTATLTGGVLTLTDTKLGGTDNAIGLKKVGSNLEISDGYSQFVAAPVGGTLSQNKQKLSIPFTAITGGIKLNTAEGNDTVNVDAGLYTTLLKAGLQLNFGDGDDTLLLTNQATNNVWNITGDQSGQVVVAKTGKIDFQALENAAGGLGNDIYKLSKSTSSIATLNQGPVGGNDSLEVIRNADFTLTDSKLTLVGASSTQQINLYNLPLVKLTGGAGNNVLNAKAFNQSVRLNGGEGNDILWGGSGNDFLNGGNGSDWLSGNGGKDTLLGYSGRDILVGGYGADKLNSADLSGSDAGDDLLIGGVTSYDTDQDAIDALLAAWANPYTYTGHIDKITTSGVGPQNKYKLNSTTLINDNTIDNLLGGDGLDWFLAGTGTYKDTHDRAGIEQVFNV